MSPAVYIAQRAGRLGGFRQLPPYMLSFRVHVAVRLLQLLCSISPCHHDVMASWGDLTFEEKIQMFSWQRKFLKIFWICLSLPRKRERMNCFQACQREWQYLSTFFPHNWSARKFAFLHPTPDIINFVFWRASNYFRWHNFKDRCRKFWRFFFQKGSDKVFQS